MTTTVCARSLLVGVMHLIVLTHVAQAQSSPPVRVRVQFTPVTRDVVSGVTWSSMTEECERIWGAEGVEIDWDADTAGAPAPDVVVPLVFDDREVGKHDRSKNQEAYGITVFIGRTQRVLVSIRRVRDLMAARRRLADSDDSTARDVVAGRLLGRVVAHELGHVLLLTTTHSLEGLMSPRLTGARLGPFERAHFGLSASDRDRIAIRFSTPGDGAAPTEALVALKGAP